MNCSWSNELIVLLICVSCCNATTVVTVITPTAIYVGTDSLAIRSENGKILPAPLEQKARIIQDRLVVATADTSWAHYFRPDGRERPIDYDFTKWIANIKKKCPANVRVAALTAIVETESRIAFKDLDRPIAGGAVPRKDTPEYYVEYLIVGYESVPTINRIYFKIDWNELRLKGPFTEAVQPSHESRACNGLDVFGWKDALDFCDRKPDTYKEIAGLSSNELVNRVIASENLSPNDAKAICLAVLNWEHKHHPKWVGPPYNIWTVPPFGAGGVSVETCSGEKLSGCKRKASQ